MGLFFKKKKTAEEEQRQRDGRERFATNVSGRVSKISEGTSRGISNIFKGIARERVRQVRFARQVKKPLLSRFASGSGGGKKRYGRRGRPYGSYDPRYASYGGVYEYRKAQALARRAQRLQLERQLKVSPNEEAYLRQLALKKRASMTAPEYKTFPDTTGRFELGSFNQEVEDASNLVP